MTTNINITQTWWRLLSAVGSTLITLVAWLGYMALCMVGEVILGIVKFIFGIIISILSMVVLEWNIHLVINTLKYKRYEQKH